MSSRVHLVYLVNTAANIWIWLVSLNHWSAWLFI